MRVLRRTGSVRPFRMRRSVSVPRPPDRAARSGRSPAGGAGRSVRAAVWVLAFVDGRSRTSSRASSSPTSTTSSGDTSVDASSTFGSMLAGETTCRVPSDTAGYWAPTAFMDGVQVRPGVMRIYYLGPAFGTVETIPAGLQMVGGNRSPVAGREPARLVELWADQDREDPPGGHPVRLPAVGELRVRRRDRRRHRVPQLLERHRLRPEDVTYPFGGSCPAGFGHTIPRLSERVHYGVMNPTGPDGTTLAFELSSGPWYTLHADFWNTWQQERLDQLVEDCLVAKAHCGSVDATSSIGVGRGSSARSATTLRTRPRPTGKAGPTSPASRTSCSRVRRTTTATTRS